ncbi:GAF domain-containing sensor histidine kinase [Flammeovirga sp. MY04]|uniref:GAF domain-containing sensor histidine kinase n=1 Tax=Flammeovirga sp. MY04 TaxID=1191459 RepID=UPI0008064258|nr:GAF domain-containing protein [Flammeovirga sp. MY04]ANQ52218.1 GAF domain-containing sensor histidine kinase [Flammeovirga sp. MY04]
MKTPKKPENEFQRIKDLYSYNVLDTLNDIDFDYITQMAAQICQTKISVVSLVDRERQWFKSKFGIDAAETPRDVSFCGHAILDPGKMLEVSDARLDERFADNPLVTGAPHVTFYAGIPLVTEEGNALGTLCVIDDQPKELNDYQKESLKILTHQVVRLLELRKRTLQIEKNNQELTKYSEHLKDFIQISTQNMNGPVLSMNSIINLALLKQPDPQIESYLKRISREIDILQDLMKDFEKYDEIVKRKENFVIYCLKDLTRDFNDFLSQYSNIYTINIHSNLEHLVIDQKSIIEIFHQLVSFFIGYSNKKVLDFDLTILENYFNYEFELKVKKLTIEKDHLKNIFDPFICKILNQKNDKKIKKDLSLIHKLISMKGGKINVTSNEEDGTVIYFSIEK